MHQIVNNLYLSNYDDVLDYQFGKNKLYTIFNCTRDLDDVTGTNIRNYRLPIDDFPCDESINQMIFHIPNYVRIIDRELQLDNVVIIHCRMGISRSATLTVAYLIWKYKISMEEAVKKVKAVKPNALSYLHFESVLKSLEELKNNKNIKIE